MKKTNGLCGTILVALVWSGGCHKPSAMIPPVERPDVAPAIQTGDADVLHLDKSHIPAMYTEMLAIDLPTVVRVAGAKNFDIRQAREAVVATRGRLESTIGSIFPALVPTALFEHVDGTVRATPGSLVGVGFNTFQASLAIQWVINPGRVVYEIIAAKKRLLASEQQKQAVVLETLRSSVVQYYELALTQARVSAALQAVSEAEELLRINRIRLRTGTGVHADELRAEARLAGRQQELALELNAFYEASIALSLTLHLDSSVTLIPLVDEFPPFTLVRDDLSIEELLELAVRYRPDLEGVRTLLEAVAADTGATWWGAFGPQFEVKYQYGGITGHSNNTVAAEGIPGNLIVNPTSPTGSFSSIPIANGFVREGISRGSKLLGERRDESFGFSAQQRFSAGTGWRLSFSAFGDLKTAKAGQAQAFLEAERQLDQVRAQVIKANQRSRTYQGLMSLAGRQVTSAQEALRLSEANLRAGTMTTLDVLQDQDAVAQARLLYAEAVVRYNQAQVNILAAIGLLEEATFAPEAEDEQAEDADSPDGA